MKTLKKYDKCTVEFYDKNYSNYDQSTHNLELTDQLFSFMKLIKPGGRILDIGCGTGRDIQQFQKAGFFADGVEPSKSMAKLAIERTKALILEKSAEDINDKEKYNGIWACASLLHLPKKRFESVIKKIARALTVNGYCYISLKEGIGEARDADGRFFSYYTEEEIKKTIKHIKNISLIKIWLSDDSAHRLSTRWINILIKKQEP